MLNIGLDLKVLSPTLFAMLVIMAIVTTMMASPLLPLFGYKQSNYRSDDVESDVEDVTSIQG